MTNFRGFIRYTDNAMNIESAWFGPTWLLVGVIVLKFAFKFTS